MRRVLAVLAVLLALASCGRYRQADARKLFSEIDRLHDLGDFTGALSRAETGLREFPQNSQPAYYWRFYLSKAEMLNDSGKFEQALALLEPGPPAGAQLASLRSEWLMDQAWAKQYLLDYPAAEHLLDRAEQDAPQSRQGAKVAFVNVKLRRALLYGDEKKFQAAAEQIASLRLSSKVVDPFVFTTYGWMLFQSARFEEAAASYEQALPFIESAKNPSRLAMVYNNLGSSYYKLGDLQRALDFTLKSESILHDIHDDVSLQVCLNLAGLIYLDRNNFAQADSYLQRSLSLAKTLKLRKEEVGVLNNLALAAVGIRAWNRADDYDRRSLALESQQHDAEAEQETRLTSARVLAGRGDFENALDALDRLSRQAWIDRGSQLGVEQEFIRIYRQRNDEARARAHYRAALALSDSVRSGIQKDENKLAWYGSQISLNQEWVRFLIDAHRPEEALEAVEASRARLLTERIGKTSSPGMGTVAAYKRLAKARNAALVSYWLMPDVSYVWIVRPDKVEFRALPGEDTFETLVGSYQSFLESKRDPLHTDSTAGEQLRKAVLDPIQPFLAGVQNVILVPDGPLHALNFETMPVNGRYWIDDVTLTIAPSLNILSADAPARPKTDPAALVIGDAQPTAEFPQLPDAGREMTTVAGLFRRSQVLNGAGATAAAYLRAPDTAQYIHFAAHASANAERPLDSAVILSGPPLTAHDLLAKPIHAELVTISACRSAGVRSYRGEGLVGFAWVFLQTGAHGVIAGLWDASDSATAQLMGFLYTGIKQGEPPAAALRQAKLKLVHGGSRFERPYYWAPFQYYQGAGT